MNDIVQSHNQSVVFCVIAVIRNFITYIQCFQIISFQIEDMGGGSRSNGLIGAGSNGSGGTVTITGGQFDFMGWGDGAFGDGTASTVTIQGGYFDTADTNANTICGISVAPNYVGVEWINNSPYYTVVSEHYSFALSGTYPP